MGDAGAEAGGEGLEAGRGHHAVAEALGGGERHLVAGVDEGASQGDHGVEVAEARNAGEQHIHAEVTRRSEVVRSMLQAAMPQGDDWCAVWQASLAAAVAVPAAPGWPARRVQRHGIAPRHPSRRASTQATVSERQFHRA